jgi:tRNA(fMet)-specific endonuclease VapC
LRWIVDTDIAIHLRDGEGAIADAVAALPRAPMLSILTRVELEGGIHRDPENADILRKRVDALLAIMRQLPFTAREVEAYGRIVEQLGYSRRMIVDRMIAATAIVADATLITMNRADFENIAELKLEVWEAAG